MKSFARWIIYHPIIFLPILLVVVGFFLSRLPDLTIDLTANFEGSTQREIYEHAVAEFGDPLSAVVLMKARRGTIFTPESFGLLDTLTSEIGALPEIGNVESLTTVRHVRGGKGFVRVEKLVHRAAFDAETLARIQDDVLKNDLLVGTLVSEDGTVAAITISFAPLNLQDQHDDRFSTERLQAIERLIAKHADDHHEILLRSKLLLQAKAHSAFRRNLIIFLPLVILIACTIIFLYYRRIDSFLIALLTIGLSVLTTLGVMAYFGIPLTQVTVVMLPLVIALTCVESVRILLVFLDHAQPGEHAQNAFLHVMRHNALPFCVTIIALAAGLGVFGVSAIPLLRQFGQAAAVSMLVSGGLALCMPAMLGRYIVRESQKERPLFLFRLAGRIAELYERSRWIILAVCLLVLILAVAGLSRLRIDLPLPDLLVAGSSQGKQVDAGDSEMAGLSTLYVMVASGQEARIKEPGVLRQIEALQSFIGKQTWCNTTTSFADYMKIVQREMQGGDKAMEVIPGSRELVSQYLLLLGNVDLGHYVNPGYSTANIVVRHHITSARSLAAAVQAVREYAATNMSSDLSVTVTSDALVEYEQTLMLLKEILVYLAGMLGVIFLVLSIVFISFKMSLAAIVPSLLALALHFGIIGWLAVPLSPEICMFAMVGFGFSADIIVHFLVRYRLHILETNDQELAVGTTMYREGEPVFLTSVGLLLGFGVFALSGSPTILHLGVFSALLMIYVFITAFFINPLILQAIQIITVWDFVRFERAASILQRSPIFKTLRRSEIKKIILLGSILELPAPEMVVRQGDVGQEMYLLLAGKAEVFLEKNNQKQVLNTIEPGDLVGEMALLGENMRSASVQAVEPTKWLRIDEKSLRRVQQSYPRIAATLFYNMSAILSDRLKAQIGSDSTT